MPNSSAQLQHCLDRLRAGDAAARDELVRCACDRLLRLTRKMLQDYSRLKRWEQTDDVFQNAVLRLDRALRTVTPDTTRDFFRLAAVHVRRELIDLARHYYGPEGHGAHHASASAAGGSKEPADSRQDLRDLADWGEFHRQVSALPEEEREMFDLLYYQGLPQAEAAALLGVNVRTVKRRWMNARLKLGERLR